MTNKVIRGNMKVSGRVCEIHCLFLLVVAILIAVQLFLQNAQKHLSEASESKTLDESEVHLEKRDISYSENKEFIEEETPFAAPVVPNIHKSFVKKKAPYVRKAKRNRKNKKKNRKDVGAKQGKGPGRKGGNDHGAKKEGGINQKEKLKGMRNDPNKNHGKSSSIRRRK